MEDGQVTGGGFHQVGPRLVHGLESPLSEFGKLVAGSRGLGQRAVEPNPDLGRQVEARSETAACSTVAGMFAYDFPTWTATSFTATMKGA